MLITQTPLRISFCGGGTDLPAFYEKAGYGAVISTAIDKFIYLAIHRYFYPKYLLKYSRTELTEHISDIQHPLIRECFLESGLRDHLELTSFADIPSSGSGLGSSSAFCVGLLHAVHLFQGTTTSPMELARQACEVEIQRLGEPIGKQDQYATAIGGMNFLRFRADGEVDVEPLNLPEGTLLNMHASLSLFFTGQTRAASEILTTQNERTKTDRETFSLLLELRALAETLRRELESGNWQVLGEILHESWEKKSRLATGISNPDLDEIYRTARNNGAVGGKILGAGGGGFFLFFCPPEQQPALETALKPLKKIPFGMEQQGVRAVFYQEDHVAAK